MALHTDLPIHKVTYDLSLLASTLTRNFPRDAKPHGAELRTLCAGMVNRIYRANCAADKVPHLSELLEHVQTTELQLRLACDLRFISPGQYARAIELTQQIGRQAMGWRKKSCTPRA